MARKKKQEIGEDPVFLLVLQMLEIADARENMSKEEFMGYWGITEKDADNEKCMIQTRLWEVEGFGRFIMPDKRSTTNRDVLLYGIPLEYAEEHPDEFSIVEIQQDLSPEDAKTLAQMGIKA